MTEWVVVPLFLGLLAYSSLVLMTWPYARPVFPLWLLVFAILVPPFFPFLWFYLLFTACWLAAPPQSQVVVVIDPRGRVRNTEMRARHPPERPHAVRDRV
jgi:hypothetical protein